MSQYRRSPPVSPKTQGGESGDMEFSWQRAWSQYTISTLRLKLLHRRDLLV